MILVDWQHIIDSPLCACSSDVEKLVALQTTGEATARHQRHCLDANSSQCSLVDGPVKDFVAMWILVGLSSGLSS